ncbi:MAG: FAD-dependent oxidoreductase [Rhodopirellula sp. JB044]|uniref:FAD-dependent oxidoreductase n=1 Tax=Rhodopirellula sp. JB044 TaxID=3342844 RepID=UPI00370B1DF1
MVRRIAVIGQGVIGLTSAAKLLDQGHQVVLFSKEPFEQTTSMSAGAYWWPHRTYPTERVQQWAKCSYDEYARLKQTPDSGVHFEEHFRFCIDPDESSYVLQSVDQWERIDASQYGFDCVEAFRVVLPVIDVPRHLNYLRDQLVERNAEFVRREIGSPADLFSEFDLVVNCTGVAARDFVGDESVFPIRGQVVRVARPDGLRCSTRVYQKDDQFTLILPRTDDVILGGTSNENDWGRDVRDEDSAAIIQRCVRAVPAIEDAEVLGATVGLRPGRHAVRLEMESLENGQTVIHNYGHGGGGFTVAWGCAEDVADLARTHFNSITANSL